MSKTDTTQSKLLSRASAAARVATEWTARKFGFQPIPPPKKRSYDAAIVDRLTQDWLAPITSGDAEIRTRLKPLRARSRELARNNPYYIAYLNLLCSNVLGKSGIGLKSNVRGPNQFTATQKTSGALDVKANSIIDDAWERFCESENYTITGMDSEHAADKCILKSAARDGDMLVNMIRGPQAQNDFNFTLQLIEGDQVDVDYNKDLGNGNQIRMGVQMDQYLRPQAYHVLDSHPGDLYSWSFTQQRYQVIAAANAVMPFMRDRASQTRGVPWAVTVMKPFQMLFGYMEAELVAARTGAAKMGFFTKTNPEMQVGERDNIGNLIMEAEPGALQELPMGVDFKPWDLNHPSQAFPFFVKAVLRSISSGLGVSYNSLANDLEGVNYSSLRSGALQEREQWMMLQTWFIDTVKAPIYKQWLMMQLMTGLIPFPFSDFDYYHKPDWKGRRWDWVDPLKDINAKIAAINAGLDSRSNVIREDGGNVVDTFTELQEDKALAASKGLNFEISANPTQEDHLPEPGDVPVAGMGSK